MSRALLLLVLMMFLVSTVSALGLGKHRLLQRSSAFGGRALNTIHMMASSAPTATQPLSSPQDLLSKTSCFIFDCDGVIWKGDSLIPKVNAVLDKLRSMGKMIFFVTNNSTKSRKGYLKKFTGLGLNVNPEGRLILTHHYLHTFHLSIPLRLYYLFVFINPRNLFQ